MKKFLAFSFIVFGLILTSSTFYSATSIAGQAGGHVPIYQAQVPPTTTAFFDVTTAEEKPIELPDSVSVDDTAFPEQSDISEYVRQVALDFLSQFPSLFVSYGFFNDETGTYWSCGVIELTSRPLFVFERDEMMWITGVADEFRLRDLDGNGIPTIFIHWSLPNTCARVWEVYRLVDGEYILAGRLPSWHYLFNDSDGNLIILDTDGEAGMSGYYRYLSFVEGNVAKETIMETLIYFDETTRQRYTEPTLLGLIPVDSLDELTKALAAEIHQNLTAQLTFARRAALLEQSGISDYGWQVAADFLSDFTSLFAGVSRAYTRWDAERQISVPTGGYWRWDSMSRQVIKTYERQEITFQERCDEELQGFFGRQGNRIYDVPWAYIQQFESHVWQYGQSLATVSYSHHYANYFNLFDFNGDGIPEIIVHFQQTSESCYAGFFRIFRYIDGAYRMLEMVTYRDGIQSQWPGAVFGEGQELFIDADGRIFVISNNDKFGKWHDHLILTDTRAEFHFLVCNSDNSQAWEEHHWEMWERTDFGHDLTDSWMLHSPTVFGTDIPFTPLHPFADLGTELYTYILHRNSTE